MNPVAGGIAAVFKTDQVRLCVAGDVEERQQRRPRCAEVAGPPAGKRFCLIKAACHAIMS